MFFKKKKKILIIFKFQSNITQINFIIVIFKIFIKNITHLYAKNQIIILLIDNNYIINLI